MGSRLGRVLLVAAALLIVAGGVGAALLASSDDGGGESVQLGGEVSTSDTTEPSPTTETEAAPTETDSAESKAGDTSADDAPSGGSASGGSASGGSASGGTRKTRFPREPKGAAENDPPARAFTVPPAREFSGTGNARLGTVKVREPVVVKWTTAGRFELRFGREAFPIIAPSSSGQLVVPAFDFELVRVIANGRWKISITPQR